MPADIKNVLELLQSKIESIDGNTPLNDLEYLFKAAKKAAGAVIYEYDSAGDLPDVNDTNVRLAFIKNRGVVAFNNGQWDYNGYDAPSSAAGWVFQGTSFGYAAAGRNSPSSTTSSIEKFSMVHDYPLGSPGSLPGGNRDGVAGQSSETAGYTSGTDVYPYATADVTKMLFSSDTTGTDALDLSVRRYSGSGQSSSSDGYTSGGRTAAPPADPIVNIIDKFPFAADNNASDVGDLTTTTYDTIGITSADNGYTAGGYGVNVTPSGTYGDGILKFPFASDTNAALVGTLYTKMIRAAGHSSFTDGYTSGGNSGFPEGNTTIHKFSFASDGAAAWVSTLAQATYGNMGQSSTTKGYSSGGFSSLIGNPGYHASLESFPFASDAFATALSPMSTVKASGAGYQI